MSSLVDALQVSPARSRRRKPAAAQTLYRGVVRSKMSVGLRVEVVLLDDRRLQLGVGPRLLTHELLAIVASHFTLKEHYYFSLAVLDSTGHYQWLTHDRRVMDHDIVRSNPGPTVTIYFLVKFYIESIMQLQGPQTVELFYQQAKNLVYKGQLELESDIAFKLAALALQATYGEFTDESSTHSQLRKSHLLPTSVIRDHPSLQYCEERVAEEHRQLLGLTRGHAILQYMSLVERLPTYGVHYYEVRDRSNLPWFLGLSHRGIAQYDFLDKRKPRRVFLWKQLENLYFRERKFSIEVHDPKRVVHTLSSFNLYEDAIEDSRDHHDELLAAITEATTQVSVSRRTFGPGNVSVYVWFAETQALCKAIWSMAIAQHQFYLDRKTSRNDVSGVQLPELAVELSRSCVSLSTHSSSSNLSRSGSHSSLVNNSLAEDSASTESLHQARMEMHSALMQRRDALQEKIKEKTEELRLLCLREGELTGELPPEYPATPGQPPPTVRKRVGTSFTLSENLISKIINKQEETVAALELEYEIRGKITSAALRIANETSARKGVRKQRKLTYQQSAQRLKDLEQKLKVARSKQAATASSMPKQKKKPRPVSDTEGVGIYDESSNSNNTTVNSSQDSPRDHLRDPQRDALHAEGISLSPAMSSQTPVSPRSPLPLSTPVRARARRDLSPGSHSIAAAGGVHSAPTSPHKQANGSVGSRPTSPNRPHSGYIPSSIYTRSQYRSQNYPTLSTRSQSVPADEGRVSHPRVTNGAYPVPPEASIVETPGGLYNIPQQRTSLACHSLDDLDTPTTTTTTTHNSTPPQHLSNNHHHHQPYRQRNDSQDRYGSLDRRRANSGRLESRSMEHLDALPSPTQQQSPQHNPTTSHSHLHHYSAHHLHPSHAASYPHHPHYHNHHFHTPEHHPLEAMDTTCDSHSNPANSSFDTASSERSSGGGDCVDGAVQYRHKGGIPGHQGYAQNHRHHSTSGPGLPTPPAQHHRGASYGAIQRSSSNTVHRLVRTSSGRSYMETTFGTEPNHNQENIPPLRPLAELLPLRPTNSLHHENHPILCSTLNNNGEHHSLKSPVSDLLPLRSTKSSCELPPLRATTTKLDPPSSHNSSMNTSMSSVTEEPLMSLAEAARLKKERGKEWYETSLDSPSSGRRSKKSTSMIEMNDSCHTNGTIIASQSNLNLSGSSVGSTGSSTGSVFQRSDSADTSQTSIPYESPRNHMIISAGTYQPSREVTKPFEMSDFYKYSTKYRRQNSGNLSMNISSTGTTSGSVSSVSSGGDTPLSPVLPPRAQVLVTNTKLHPPSPNLVAHHSTPTPQQKGVYQPLSPLTCQPLEVLKGSPATGDPQDPVGSGWETAPLHQAVPATVTHKRSATLV